MKIFLFPRVFRTIGWILFIPALCLGIMLIYGLLSLSGTAETIVNDIAITGIALGSLFITCSRERVEDEMTGLIRLKSLLSSLYCYITCLIVLTLSVNGMYFLNVMIANLAIFPIIFAIRFYCEMHKYYRQNSDEE